MLSSTRSSLRSERSSTSSWMGRTAVSPVRVYYPSKPGPAEGGALIYVHGGGFIVGTLDQFDTATRMFSEISGAQVYGVDCKLAPEYQWPTQIEEVEFVVRWLLSRRITACLICSPWRSSIAT
jgi:acetyl esterase/lipase